VKKNEVKLGGIYIAKVSGKLARVRIMLELYAGGWSAVNIETGRWIHVKSAARLRGEVQP